MLISNRYNCDHLLRIAIQLTTLCFILATCFGSKNQEARNFVTTTTTTTTSAITNSTDLTNSSSPTKEHHSTRGEEEYEFSDNDDLATADIGDNNNNNYRNMNYDGNELTEEWAGQVCSRDRGVDRRQMLENIFLRFCWRHKLINLLSSNSEMWLMHNSSQDCRQILMDFIRLDEKIHYFDELFTKLLDRYNCQNGYSVKWTCVDCRRAYTDWLCTTNLPYFMQGERVKPCISYCERVEQRCPYFHPVVREQYGGQPLFICEDPRIQEMPEMAEDALYGHKNNCYDLCHLKAQAQQSQQQSSITFNKKLEFDADIERDTLSKYEPDNCPTANFIATQVSSAKRQRRRRLELVCQREDMSNNTLVTSKNCHKKLGLRNTAASSGDQDHLQTQIFEELENVVKSFKVQKSKAGNFVHNQPR